MAAPPSMRVVASEDDATSEPSRRSAGGAPAGSGKTTTLVARIAWLLGSGAARPGTVAAITFNKRAAVELGERLGVALAPLDLGEDAVRVRTFHALGLEILRDAGCAVEPLVDRIAILRRIATEAGPAGWRRLDTAFSKLKLDLALTAGERPDSSSKMPNGSPRRSSPVPTARDRSSSPVMPRTTPSA